MTKTKQWLSYWRNSLADAESGKGALNKDDIKALCKIDVNLFRTGDLSADPALLVSLFEGETKDTQLVEVVYRPMVHKVLLQHGKKKSSLYPEYVAPLLCRLWVNREGLFVPAAFPVIPRDILSPLSEDSFTILSVEMQDEFLTKREPQFWSYDEALSLLDKEDRTFWQDYCSVARDLLNLSERKVLQDDFIQVESAFLVKTKSQLGASLHIIGLYDWLSNDNASLPLLNQYTNTESPPLLSCATGPQSFMRRLGHGSTQYPLTFAQRDALGQVLSMEEGEILAVNGPPGTGKTTFVLSLVVSNWVAASITESEPPLIVAASTNNQAVTNILEAFEKGFEMTKGRFGGRWLSKMKSYGGYFPARSREAKEAKHYQTASFYKEMERPEAVKLAEEDFLENARVAFDDESLLSVSKVKKRLHDGLLAAHQSLEKVLAAWKNRNDTEVEWRAIDLDPEAFVAKKQVELDSLLTLESVIKQDLNKWRHFCTDESWLLSLLSFLPSVARKRRLRRELFIDAQISEGGQRRIKEADGSSEQNVERLLKQWMHAHSQISEALQADIEGLRRLKADYEMAREMFSMLWSELEMMQAVPDSFAELDSALDISLRFTLFQLATHYWEARWLEDCVKQRKDLKLQADTGKEKTGLKSVRPRWQRRMKLTPCVVSTLYALPSHMTHQVFEGDAQYRKEYLTQEIDLLIIDEAGQVAPEVAGASISLAKRAVMIGDVSQIKPVVGVTPSVNLGNLFANSLIASQDEYEAVKASGRSVVGGSAMHVAQASSQYHYLSEAEPGMYLREHRRCLEPIISFCNDLCYQGLLQPLRNTAAVDSLIPPFAYVHVDGRSERLSSGSRVNELEAITIAEWLLSEKERIESAHGLPLAKIVGIASPFKAQSELIKEKCQELGIEVGSKADEVTVGTVHALQGAERPVVIFSMVYSRHGDGTFIDQDPSVLNVAVSRAKDSFIVFGDMEVITNAAMGTPRALLARYLLKDEDSRLTFRVNKARPDLLKFCKEPKLISNSEDHDQWLKDVLQHAQKRVAIVSPWLSLDKLKEAGFIQAFTDAITRGVEVIVYTDRYFNTRSNNRFDSEKSNLFDENCSELMVYGVVVNVVNQVHSKLVMGDDIYLCVGSYNWASAVRDGKYKNMETSLAYTGSLHEEISTQLSVLNSHVYEEKI
jgi:ABC-type branched-subunit amino acid transport system ATPase component